MFDSGCLFPNLSHITSPHPTFHKYLVLLHGGGCFDIEIAAASRPKNRDKTKLKGGERAQVDKVTRVTVWMPRRNPLANGLGVCPSRCYWPIVPMLPSSAVPVACGARCVSLQADAELASSDRIQYRGPALCALYEYRYLLYSTSLTVWATKGSSMSPKPDGIRRPGSFSLEIGPL